MNTPPKEKTISIKPKPISEEERCVAAAKAMSKELTADHKRWSLPLLTWKNGKVVEVEI